MKIRRIVVGLDIAPHSRSALAAAALLARELDADLDALFVESDELHRLAGLPFAREMGVTSASVRRMDPGALERSFEAQAREARRALTALADPRSVRWSFRVTRGSVAEAMFTACAGADLAVMGTARWGPEALRPAQGACATLVVLPRREAVRGSLAAICPVGVDPAQAVSLLCPLAHAVGDGLTILVVGDDVELAGRWCVEASALLDERGRKARLEIVRDGQPEALQAALARIAPRALALIAPVQPGP